MWKITNWKKYLKNIVIHAIKQRQNLLCLLSKPKFTIVFLKIMVCIAMNVNIPAVIYVHHIYKNV